MINPTFKLEKDFYSNPYYDFRYNFANNTASSLSVTSFQNIRSFSSSRPSTPLSTSFSTHPSIHHSTHSPTHSPTPPPGTPATGPVVSFHAISYSINVRSKGCFSRRQETILHDVSGIFRPGMNAIMGPTGCGKTTLLDILADRKEKSCTKGVTLIDDVKQGKNFHSTAGYVVQDDLIMGTLTVRENLMFSANMRLPPHVTAKEKQQRVEGLIEELGLSKCADTKVGTEFVRGVSGGERKRTCIGMELVVSPSILFLDEPTTGLDASTANSVMSLLHKLSKQGLTVIFSIHQPRYSIFKLFDTLMLLAMGRVVYHGHASVALQHFSSQNFQCEEHDNPSDFFLDVINGDIGCHDNLSNPSSLHFPSPEGAYDKKLSFQGEQGVDGDSGVFEYASRRESETRGDSREAYNGMYKKRGNLQRIAEHAELGGVSEKTPAVVKALVDNYKASDTWKSIKAELKRSVANSKKFNKAPATPPHRRYANTFLVQLWYVSQRTLKNVVRNPAAFIVQLSTMLLFGLVVGGLFYDITDDVGRAVHDRAGAFFFIIIIQMFGNLSAIELFLKERKLFLHEARSDFYRVSVYFLSKVLFDLLPLRLIPLCLFCLISYFLMGLVMEADKFFIFFVALLMTSLVSAALTFAISAFVHILAIANILVGLIYILMTLFAGLLINISSIPAFLKWLQYLSIVRYSFKTLLINEITNATYYVYVNQSIVASDTQQSEIFLRSQQIFSSSGWELWQNMVILCVASAVLLLLCFLQLLRLSARR